MLYVYKLPREFFPDEMTESNTFHCFEKSFFLTKKDHDGISRKHWNVYNWETRNKIIGHSDKERVIALVAREYDRFALLDVDLIGLVFTPPPEPKKRDKKDE